MAEFDDQLKAWLQGEVSGEAYFTSLAHNVKSPNERAKWALLAELEGAMKDRLAASLHAAGAELPPDPGDLQRTSAFAAETAKLPWREQLEGLHPRLEDFVATIRTEAAKAPACHLDIAQDFVAHEEALLAFTNAELDRRDGTPEITALLEAWDTR